MSFDTRSRLLSEEIRDEWEEHIKEQHRQNRQRLILELQKEYGTAAFDAKIRNFVDLGPKSISVLAFHGRFLEQARQAFVVGAYYPAATGACALGERILNHLILRLRDYHTTTPEYRKVHRKESFDNWEMAIDVLEAWGVLLPEPIRKFRELWQNRNSVLHFNLATEKFDRDIALSCIQRLDKIIADQFSAIGPQPWFIPGARGESYIRKDATTQPFVKEIYLPNSQLVGPRHHLEFQGGRFVVQDSAPYEDREVTDAEFLALRAAHREKLA